MNLKKQLMLGVVACFSVFSAHASKSPVDWEAQWIWQEAAGPQNTWMAFRKEFELSQLPGQVLAHIAVDSKYWLWVNGELVQFEGGMARGPNRQDTYYESLDLAPFLKQGENTVAVLVWHWGRSRKSHLDSGQGGLVLQADLGDHVLKTDATWKMKVHPAYDPESGGGGNPRQVPQFNVKFDANQALGDWTENAWYLPGYDDSDWEPAIEKGAPPVAPWNELVKNEVPLLKDYGLQYYENYPESAFPFVWEGGLLSCKLPFNKQITPYMEIETSAGQSIKIRVDNGANTVVGLYNTRDGVQTFESYTWMNGHEVVYLMPRGVTVKSLQYRWTGVGEMPGTFESSDADLTRLWWMARNTLYVCARDTFMDCPDRERGLWIGDVADQTGPVFYTMDGAGRQLLKKAIMQTIAFSKNDIIAGLAPGFQDEFFMQSLQYIEQGIWQYYFNTGDQEVIEAAYPLVRAYLDLWEIRENGRLVTRRSDKRTNWPDWGAGQDRDVIEPLYYIMGLQGAVKMAELLGQAEDVEMFEARIQLLKTYLNKVAWKGTHYSSRPDFKDDRANALAILVGVADSDKYSTILENVLIPVRNASPHMEWMVQEAMIKAGYLEEAIERMKVRYGPQIEMEGRTTLDEYMGVAEGGTYNHAWNAPNYILSRYVAGIAAEELAWTRYHVLPNLLHTTELKQVVPSVQGEITVEIKLVDSVYGMKLDSPEGTTAVVGIPKASIAPSVIEVNGTTIWEHGDFKGGLAGIRWEDADDAFIKFEVDPGQWTFIARPH